MPNESIQIYIILFSALLMIVGIVIFITLRASSGVYIFKLPGGIEFETSTPSIAIFFVGAILMAFSLANTDINKTSFNTFDGFYLGERGYDNPPMGKENECRTKYKFNAIIKGDKVTSKDVHLNFNGTVNSNGELLIKSSDVNPPTNTFFKVFGPLTAAAMESGFCGSGYFKLVSDN